MKKNKKYIIAFCSVITILFIFIVNNKSEDYSLAGIINGINVNFFNYNTVQAYNGFYDINSNNEFVLLSYKNGEPKGIVVDYRIMPIDLEINNKSSLIYNQITLYSPFTINRVSEEDEITKIDLSRLSNFKIIDEELNKFVIEDFKDQKEYSYEIKEKVKASDNISYKYNNKKINDRYELINLITIENDIKNNVVIIYDSKEKEFYEGKLKGYIGEFYRGKIKIIENEVVMLGDDGVIYKLIMKNGQILQNKYWQLKTDKLVNYNFEEVLSGSDNKCKIIVKVTEEKNGEEEVLEWIVLDINRREVVYRSDCEIKAVKDSDDLIVYEESGIIKSKRYVGKLNEGKLEKEKLIDIKIKGIKDFNMICQIVYDQESESIFLKEKLPDNYIEKYNERFQYKSFVVDGGLYEKEY